MVEQQNQDINTYNSVVEQLRLLRREDEHLHNIWAVDVWALAKTMDEFQPGFWSAFMANRDKTKRKV